MIIYGNALYSLYEIKKKYCPLKVDEEFDLRLPDSLKFAKKDFISCFVKNKYDNVWSRVLPTNQIYKKCVTIR